MFTGSLVVILIVVAVVVILIVAVIGLYNSLITARNKVDNAWSQIDVQLQQRHDLVPNLVETVKGYAAHESKTFEAVTEARNAAINAQGVADTAAAENMLTGALKSLFAVAEAYPELKANTNFLQLQEKLGTLEEKIAYARQFYNDTAMMFNNKVQTFPSNLIAGMFNFNERDYFDAATEAEAVPAVSFS